MEKGGINLLGWCRLYFVTISTFVSQRYNTNPIITQDLRTL